MNTPRTAPPLAADFYDGVSGRAQPVRAWVDAGQLHWGAEGASSHTVPASSATWPERQRHGQRQLQLPGGGVLVFGNAAAFDAWAAAGRGGDSAVVRWQQSWRLTALALVLMTASLLGLWRWGIPAAASVAVAWVPQAVAQEVGQRTLAYVSDAWLKPSKLQAPVQAELLQRFAAAARAAQPATGPQPVHRIRFMAGGKLGPNAFALPGGDIVVTDELVLLLKDEPQAVVGVLAHELGHVKHNHGLRQAVQAAALGVLAGLVVGDFSILLSTTPVLLAQMDYSRDFEREADVYARNFLRGAGISPRVMVSFFERIDDQAKAQGGASASLPIAFSSHPANADRIAFFSQD